MIMIVISYFYHYIITNIVIKTNDSQNVIITEYLAGGTWQNGKGNINCLRKLAAVNDHACMER